MRFRDTLPLLPSVALVLFVGAYLWIDDAAEAELATLQQTVPTSPDNSTELTKLQQTVQALQTSNKSLSDQIGSLAARLDNLEKAHAEIRELPRGRARLQARTDGIGGHERPNP